MLILRILSPFIALAVLLTDLKAMFEGGSMLADLRARWGFAPEPSTQPTTWVHAASVG